MFSKAKQLFGGSANKITGRLDVLQAICAAGALVASAGDGISDDEIKAIQKSVQSNATISAAFSAPDISKTLSVMIGRAESGRVGKVELKREIEEVAAKGDDAINVLILCGALDVADSDGNISDDERKVLDQVAGILGLKVSDYV